MWGVQQLNCQNSFDNLWHNLSEFWKFKAWCSHLNKICNFSHIPNAIWMKMEIVWKFYLNLKVRFSRFCIRPPHLQCIGITFHTNLFLLSSDGHNWFYFNLTAYSPCILSTDTIDEIFPNYGPVLKVKYKFRCNTSDCGKSHHFSHLWESVT